MNFEITSVNNGCFTEEVIDPDLDLDGVYMRVCALNNGWGIIEEVNDELRFVVYDEALNKLKERPLPDDILHNLMYSAIIYDGTASYLVAQTDHPSTGSSTQSPIMLRIIEVNR